jgi:hypothetical protein
MTGPQVLVRETEEERKRALVPSPDMGWYLLGAVGLVFFGVGLFDVLLAWYPLNFGNPEYEFATYSQVMNFMPLPTLGLVMFLAGGVARGIKWVPKFVAVVLVLMTVGILAGAVLYATNVPMALKAIPDPVILTGLKKQILKTAFQAGVYPLLMVYVSVKAWRHATAAAR